MNYKECETKIGIDNKNLQMLVNKDFVGNKIEKIELISDDKTKKRRIEIMATRDLGGIKITKKYTLFDRYGFVYAVDDAPQVDVIKNKAAKDIREGNGLDAAELMRKDIDDLTESEPVHAAWLELLKSRWELGFKKGEYLAKRKEKYMDAAVGVYNYTPSWQNTLRNVAAAYNEISKKVLNHIPTTDQMFPPKDETTAKASKKSDDVSAM